MDENTVAADQKSPTADSPLATTPFDRSAWRGQAYAGQFGTDGTLIKGWSDHEALCHAAFKATYPKGSGPAVMYGTSVNLRRRNQDLLGGGYSTGLAIDLDEDVPSLEPIVAVLAKLESLGVTYHFQYRPSFKSVDGVDVLDTYKVHIAIPYASPYPVLDVDASRRFQAELTARVLGDAVKFDFATTKVAGLFYLMTLRPVFKLRDLPSQRFFNGQNALDMLTMYPPWLQGVKSRRKARTESRDETTLLRSVLDMKEWVPAKEAWEITCPVGHDEDYGTKTYLYPSGVISCMAGKCQGKPVAWFIDHLEPEDQVRIAQASTMLRIEAAQPKVSVTKAGQAIHDALDANRSIENNATVIQVSTGAGKTRAIAEKLNVYSAPYEDEGEGSGLTSVLAVPTNALLREVEQRLEVPHRRQFGVLAVLNEDGTPGCKKYEAAMAVQKANGNVHKLLCGHCEYKDNCYARENASTGVGALTLTNHALMSTVAKSLHDKGRHPLLVWDESPAWTSSAEISMKDLTWLIAEFDREAAPTRTMNAMLDAMVDVKLFSAKYRITVRPVIEAVRWISRAYVTGTIATKRAVNIWARIPSHRMMVDRAIRVLDLVSTGDAWKDMVESFTGAFRLNTTEMGFDGMRPETQKRVLRAERLVGSLGMIAGEDSVMVLAEHFLMLASLTPSGELFRRSGGVVLDATANVAELRALRPDVKVVSLRVEDRGDSQRYMHHVASLDRKSLSHRTDRLVQCIQHARSTTRRWGNAEGIVKPKVAVFTYRIHADQVRKAWPEAEVGYFGNTRGYDRFFQEGFDTFVTLGDPISNLTSLALQWRVLTGANPQDGDEAWAAYIAASAESELAQAHGRARSPQAKLGRGGRLHLHYGRKVPSGWSSENFRLDSITFKDTDPA